MDSREFKLVVVNDCPIDVTPIREAVQHAFDRREDGPWTVHVEICVVAVPTSGRFQEEARHLHERAPQVILCDCYLPFTVDDGPNLLRALCCEGDQCFTGFAYLWTSSHDVENICEKHRPLFEGPGGAGFHHRDYQGLARRIAKDHDACRGFHVPDPRARCFNPLDRALDILSDVMPVCLVSDLPDRRLLLDAAAIAVGVDHRDPGYDDSFVHRVATLFGNRSSALYFQLQEVLSVAKALRNCGEQEVVEGVARLRDAMLLACATCGYA